MSPAAEQPLHATAIALAVDADGPLAGVLILGPSGAGKSSLALAAIELCPFQRSALIADDAVFLARIGERLVASGPQALAGLIEVRGFGPARIRTSPRSPLLFAVDLGAAPARVAEPLEFQLNGETPALPLFPFVWREQGTTAPARLRRMAASILCGQTARRTQDSRPG